MGYISRIGGLDRTYKFDFLVVYNRMESLGKDIWELIAKLLSAWDLGRLMHTNKQISNIIRHEIEKIDSSDNIDYICQKYLVDYNDYSHKSINIYKSTQWDEFKELGEYRFRIHNKNYNGSTYTVIWRYNFIYIVSMNISNFKDWSISSVGKAFKRAIIEYRRSII